VKKILVLGGGTAGVETAIFLRKEGFDVELVSDRDFFYIYPISIWIPTGEIDLDNASIPLRDLAKVHGFSVTFDKVESISASEMKVFLKNSGERNDFDYLVIALGQSKIKHEGLEHTLSICGSPEEALKIREKVNELVKRGGGKIAFGFGGNPKAKEAVRGGPVFEILFNIHNYLEKIGVRKNFELIFFSPMEKPGARLGNKALKMLDAMFKKMNIKKFAGKKIKRFTERSVVFEDGSSVDADLILFTPGGTGHPVVKRSDLPQTESGFLKIEDSCQVSGFENIYAAGDVVSIDGPDWKAKQGHLAEIMGRNIAHNIAIKEGLKNGDIKGYREHINILCLMDMGKGGGLAYRSEKKAFLIPLPVVGHYIKKGWGIYYRLSKLGKIPRIPGM